jgi:hypothetical protein
LIALLRHRTRPRIGRSEFVAREPQSRKLFLKFLVPERPRSSALAAGGAIGIERVEKADPLVCSRTNDTGELLFFAAPLPG